jgi:hypothetical protein
MSALNWQLCRDGERRTEIRVSHLLTAEDMIGALAVYASERLDRQSDDSFPPLPKAPAMEAIRWVLKNYPDRARGLWAEYIYPEDAEGIRQWATQQVRRLTR